VVLLFRNGEPDGALMKTAAAIKRTAMIDGRKTSVSLEDSFWTALNEIARSQGVTVSSLVTSIAAARKQSNLSSEIRVFVLEHFRNKDKSAAPPHSTRAAVNS
jgi:predicted DNA-binding ribbon-helix-helix protein